MEMRSSCQCSDLARELGPFLLLVQRFGPDEWDLSCLSSTLPWAKAWYLTVPTLSLIVCARVRGDGLLQHVFLGMCSRRG